MLRLMLATGSDAEDLDQPASLRFHAKKKPQTP